MAAEVKRDYYIAGGRALENILAWEAQKARSLAVLKEIFEETGAERGETHSDKLRLIFPYNFDKRASEKPKTPGWVRESGSSTRWRIDRTTPEGKALVKRLKAAPYPHRAELKLSDDSTFIFNGFSVIDPEIEQVGDQWIIGMPRKTKKVQPWDSTPIKTSAVWALKEAEEAKATGVVKAPKKPKKVKAPVEAP